VNARKNVPSVDGAITPCPKTSPVLPALTTSMSSMLSAPASIPCTNVITFRPGSAAPGTPAPSNTVSFTNRSTPNRPANDAVNNNPASLGGRGVRAAGRRGG
jgi:hypothetical protein